MEPGGAWRPTRRCCCGRRWSTAGSTRRAVERPGGRRDRRPADRRRAASTAIMAEAEATLNATGRARDEPRPRAAGRRGLVHHGRRRRRSSLGAQGHGRRARYFFPTGDRGVRQPARAGRGARGGRSCRGAGRLWSWTTNHYAPPEPYVVARPVRAVHRVRGRAAEPSRWSCSASSRPAPTPTRLAVGMEMELVLGTLYEDDEHEYVVWQWSAAHERSRAMSGDARSPSSASACTRGASGAATSSSTASSPRRPRSPTPASSGATSSSSPAATPSATATPATSPARRSRRRSAGTGAQVASSYAACASGATALSTARAQILAGLCDVALVVGADTTPKGFLAPERGRARRRPRLAALPPARRDQPDLLRAVRPPAHGAVRRDHATTSPRSRSRTRGTASQNP